MKTSNRYKVKSQNIHSLKDIDMEKQRLRNEIMKTEADIHAGYRNILQAFTLKNLAATMINDVAATSSVLSKVFSFGKVLMETRKKKKHDKQKAVADDPPL